ncbi:MAG: DUF4013 domain-containing protein [Vampirovibrio sp.]|nr:DUF4013 domain-containing protein [Vampirovibrio sp.]
MNFAAALKHPFKKENWKNTLLWPGLLMLAYFAVSFIIGMISGFASVFAGDGDTARLAALAIRLPLELANMLINLVMIAPLYGFLWHYVGRLVQDGDSGLAPDWMPNIKRFFIDGMKLVLYYCVIVFAFCLVIGIVLGGLIALWLFTVGSTAALKASMTESSMLAFLAIMGVVLVLMFLQFLLTPFFIAPIVYNTQEKSLKQLFNIRRGIELTLPRYGNTLLAQLWIIAAALIYMVAAIPILLTCVGALALPALFYGSLMCTYAHLFTQAFQPPSYGSGQSTSPPPQQQLPPPPSLPPDAPLY